MKPVASCLTVLALLACATPLAAAQPVPASARFEARGEVHLSGSFAGNLTAIALAHAPGQDVPGPLEWAPCDLHVVVIDEPVQQAVLPPESPMGVRAETPLPARTVHDGRSMASLSVRLAEDSDVRLLGPAGPSPAAGGLHATLRSHAPPRPRGFAPMFPPANVNLPEDAGYLDGTLPRLRVLEGAWRLYAYNASLEVVQSDGNRTTFETGPAEDGPSVSGQAGILHRVYAVVDGQGCRPFPSDADPSAWTVVLRSLSGRFEGDMAAEDASVRANVNRSVFAERAGLVQVIGRWSMDASVAEGRSSWSLDGEAAYAAIDGRAIAGLSLPTIWVAAGIGVALAGLGSASLRSAFLGGFHRAVALAHPTRVRLLRLLSAHPGITRMDLARRGGVSRRTAMHHLEILVTSGLVCELRTTRSPAYVPNSGSYAFAAASREPGHVPVSAGHAFALIQRRPLRALLIETLTREGPLSYQGLAERWHAEGRPVASAYRVSRHAGALARAGILKRQQRAGQAVWSLAVDLERTSHHQRGALLTAQGLGATYAVLHAMGEGTVGDLRRALPRRSKASIASDLGRLVAYGFANHDEASDTFRPSA